VLSALPDLVSAGGLRAGQGAFVAPVIRSALILYRFPLELLDRLEKPITPPRIHKHRYCGVLAPNARLRRAVIETSGPAGATLQLLQEAFVLDPPVTERILAHIGEPTTAPEVLPARGPPQTELGFDPVDQTAGQNAWPEMDQTAGAADDTWA